MNNENDNAYLTMLNESYELRTLKYLISHDVNEI